MNYHSSGSNYLKSWSILNILSRQWFVLRMRIPGSSSISIAPLFQGQKLEVEWSRPVDKTVLNTKKQLARLGNPP